MKIEINSYGSEKELKELTRRASLPYDYTNPDSSSNHTRLNAVNYLRNRVDSFTAYGTRHIKMTPELLQRISGCVRIILEEEEPCTELRQFGLETLAMIEKQKALPILQKYLDMEPCDPRYREHPKTEKVETRMAVASALSYIPQCEKADSLLEILKTDPNPSVSKQAKASERYRKELK